MSVEELLHNGKSVLSSALSSYFLFLLDPWIYHPAL